MSTFITKCKDRKTGEVFEVLCIDDFFGSHAYGYCIGGVGEVIPEKEFQKKYEVIHA